MKSKPGRPIGSSETPNILLRRSMQSASKLAAQARRMLETRLEYIEKQLDNPNLTPQESAILTYQIMAIMTALDKTVESTGKLLTQKRSAGDDSQISSVTTESILTEMTKGKKP